MSCTVGCLHQPNSWAAPDSRPRTGELKAIGERAAPDSVSKAACCSATSGWRGGCGSAYCTPAAAADH